MEKEIDNELLEKLAKEINRAQNTRKLALKIQGLMKSRDIPEQLHEQDYDEENQIHS